MSVCAVMMVKDEADIIEVTVRHLLAHVDEVLVADNMSTDGTLEILRELPVRIVADDEVGYFQSEKMTRLAGMARDVGHEWVVPCDADEIWHPDKIHDEISLGSWLSVHAKNVGVVRADLYNHVVTPEDPAVPDPVERLGWRWREAGALPKVAARLLPGLVIEQGNHGAHFPGAMAAGGGLSVRHFPYRSLEQFVSKVRNGAAAYAATDLPWSMGQHWREYGQHYERGGEEALEEIYSTWFTARNPMENPDLIYDPAPVRR